MQPAGATGEGLFLQDIQRRDGHRFGRGGDHGFGLRRPEGTVERGQLGRVAAGCIPLCLGTPPTQKIVLCLDLSASQKRLKSSAAITGFGSTTRSPPKCD